MLYARARRRALDDGTPGGRGRRHCKEPIMLTNTLVVFTDYGHVYRWRARPGRSETSRAECDCAGFPSSRGTASSRVDAYHQGSSQQHIPEATLDDCAGGRSRGHDRRFGNMCAQ